MGEKGSTIMRKLRRKWGGGFEQWWDQLILHNNHLLSSQSAGSYGDTAWRWLTTICRPNWGDGIQGCRRDGICAKCACCPNCLSVGGGRYSTDLPQIISTRRVVQSPDNPRYINLAQQSETTTACNALMDRHHRPPAPGSRLLNIVTDSMSCNLRILN